MFLLKDFQLFDPSSRLVAARHFKTSGRRGAENIVRGNEPVLKRSLRRPVVASLDEAPRALVSRARVGPVDVPAGISSMSESDVVTTATSPRHYGASCSTSLASEVFCCCALRSLKLRLSGVPPVCYLHYYYFFVLFPRWLCLHNKNSSQLT